jgi:hypothetical protein
VKYPLPMTMVIISLAICRTGAAQGRGGGAQAGGAHIGGGVPPGAGWGQFPILPVHVPGGGMPGFGPLPLPRSALLPFFPDGRKGHGLGPGASQVPYWNVPMVLPLPYASPPAQDQFPGDQTSNAWVPPPPLTAMPGQGVPGSDFTLNDPGPFAAHQGSGLRTIQAPTPPPAVIRDEYPALLVLKDGSMRSVSNYAVTENTLYFVTPHGESLHVPIGLLDHIYPAVKPATSLRDGATTDGSPKSK